MPGPAATISHMHTCPMWSGNTPHVGGPVLGPGVPTVLIGGKPAAVMGDQCTCSGPPDVIVKGEATVLIGGKSAATMGSTTAHGGVITLGEPTVLFGTGGSGATAVMAVKKIPFPKISLINKVLGNNKEAIANQEAIKNESESTEGEPKIYGVRWIVGDEIVRASKVFKEVTIQAHVLNIPDGESITFSVMKPTAVTNEEGDTVESEEDIIELTGTVQDKMVEVDWEIEKAADDVNDEGQGTEVENEQTAPLTSNSNGNTETNGELSVTIEYTNEAFVPFGIANHDGIAENEYFNFNFEIIGANAESLRVEISNNGELHYEEDIADSQLLQIGNHQWQWDGFDNLDNLDTAFLKEANLQVKIIASNSGSNSESTCEINQLKTKKDWVDVNIQRNLKQILVTIRINLRDGGERGLQRYDKMLADFSPPAYESPIGVRTKTFAELENLALEAMSYYWSRKASHPTGKNITIKGEAYELEVKAVSSDEDAIKSPKIIFVSNKKPGRSRNWELSRILYYNTGYVKAGGDWYYRNEELSNNDFKHTAAHEIGHEILLGFGGHGYSKKHKGTSTLLQHELPNTPLPVGVNVEYDLMHYTDDESYPDGYYSNSIASEKDVLSLVWLSKMKS